MEGLDRRGCSRVLPLLGVWLLFHSRNRVGSLVDFRTLLFDLRRGGILLMAMV
jgi:hypothetical protein